MAYIIGIVVSFVGAAVLTYLVGFEDTAVKAAPATVRSCTVRSARGWRCF